LCRFSFWIFLYSYLCIYSHSIFTYLPGLLPVVDLREWQKLYVLIVSSSCTFAVVIFTIGTMCKQSVYNNILYIVRFCVWYDVYHAVFLCPVVSNACFRLYELRSLSRVCLRIRKRQRVYLIVFSFCLSVGFNHSQGGPAVSDGGFPALDQGCGRSTKKKNPKDFSEVTHNVHALLFHFFL